MKLSEVIQRYNFNKVLKELPKEFKDAIKNIDDAAKEIYPDYKSDPDPDSEIAPTFCQLYFDWQTGKIKNENEITDLAIDLCDRFHLNMNGDLEQDPDYESDNSSDSDDDEDYEVNYSIDEIADRDQEFESAVGDELEKLVKLWKKTNK
jgi:hypothetical protein